MMEGGKGREALGRRTGHGAAEHSLGVAPD